MAPNCRVYAAFRTFRDLTLTPHLLANLRIKVNEVVRVLDFPELIQISVDKILHAMLPHFRHLPSL